MRKRLLWAMSLALATTAGTAGAHELTCEKTVNGQVVLEVSEYPATLRYDWTIQNVASAPSDVAWVTDSMFPSIGIAPPVTIPVGGSVSGSATLTLASFAECEALATPSACAGDACAAPFVENVLAAGFDLGEAQCRARVVCTKPRPPPPAGATRTLGFFKTHVAAGEACVAAGALDLGFVTVDTTAGLLGLLWASPARFSGGAPREGLDQDRLLLARQTAVAICNERLFGTSSGGLVAQAVAALAGTACADLSALTPRLDAFDGSGDAVPFPAGFDPGSAAPQEAAALGVDPTSPSGQACTP